MEAIITAAITGAVTLIVCLINNTYQRKQILSLLEYKIEELTKKVEKHNNVIERTFLLEQKEAVQEEQIKVINHRLQDLENK